MFICSLKNDVVKLVSSTLWLFKVKVIFGELSIQYDVLKRRFEQNPGNPYDKYVRILNENHARLRSFQTYIREIFKRRKRATKNKFYHKH